MQTCMFWLSSTKLVFAFCTLPHGITCCDLRQRQNICKLCKTGTGNGYMKISKQSDMNVKVAKSKGLASHQRGRRVCDSHTEQCKQKLQHFTNNIYRVTWPIPFVVKYVKVNIAHRKWGLLKKTGEGESLWTRLAGIMDETAAHYILKIHNIKYEFVVAELQKKSGPASTEMEEKITWYVRSLVLA